ncbi:MAG: hypothetical protein BWY71_01912 [Planctomycetes bacterium ADurb.Bin412]|nr:MAG: hypothetical protein BWY71_01912 [Planctomycetes bacterium ADurb.Bin412]
MSQSQFFLLHQRTGKIQQNLQDIRQRTPGPVHLHFARFHFGQVQQIINDPQQHMARIQHVCSIPHGFGIVSLLGLVFHNFCKTQNGVERGAQFMGDIGQEFAFQLVGFK